MTDFNKNTAPDYVTNVSVHSSGSASTNNNENGDRQEAKSISPAKRTTGLREIPRREGSWDSFHQNDSARTSSSSNSAWSPRKISDERSPSQKSAAKRKLSETRGVNLPDIKIVDPRVFSSQNGSLDSDPLPQNNVNQSAALEVQTTANSLSGSQLSPPMTSSPVGHVLRHPLAAPSPTGNSGTLTANKAVLNICIFLPDQKGIQFSVEGGRLATADALLKLVWEHLGLPGILADEVFALWMVSPLLEIQMKGHHIPFQVRKYWSDLLRKFTTANSEDIALDEPLIVFRRNVLLSKRKQRILCDNCEKASELLFLDARECVLNGKYVCDLSEALRLAAIDMVLSLGPFDPAKHTPNFIREVAEEFLPEHHLTSPKSWSLFSWAFKACKGRDEVLLDNYRNLSGRTHPELHEMYLDICMKFPFYGAAFFNGQIEKPPSTLVRGKGTNVRRLLKGDPDAPVTVAISRDFFTVVDCQKHTVLLAEPCMDCSWRKVPAADPQNPNCLPSFFLHFPDPEEDTLGGTAGTVGYAAKDNEVDMRGVSEGRSKLLQIFSKQAVMMEALLNSFVEYAWSESEQSFDMEDIPDIDAPVAQGKEARGEDNVDVPEDMKDTVALAGDTPASPVLSNKLGKLCLATFDAHGNCVQAMGSLHQVLRDK